MKELIKELKDLLEKHDAYIYIEQDYDSFLSLQLRHGGEKIDVDCGYRNLEINISNLNELL